MYKQLSYYWAFLTKVMSIETGEVEKSSNTLWLFDEDSSNSTDPVVNPIKHRAGRKKRTNAKSIVLPHSKAKLTLYSNYIEKYLAILSVVPFIDKIHVFDIFCGTGIYNDGKVGSPIIAFNNIVKVDEFLRKSHKTSIKPTVLYVNDLDKKNVKKVEQHLSDQPVCPNLSVKYHNLDAQQMLEEVLNLVKLQSHKERNLIFLDPYGYSQIKRETIAKLMGSRKVEIILFYQRPLCIDLRTLFKKMKEKHMKPCVILYMIFLTKAIR